MEKQEARAQLLEAARDGCGDVVGAALWIAVEDSEDVSRDHYLEVMDELGAELRTRLGTEPTAAVAVAVVPVLAGLLRDRMHLRGVGGGDPRAHYLNQVIERGVGVPIACAAVWMSVGRRAGITVDGVGLPGRFMARVQGVLVDAARGELIDEAEVPGIVAQAVGHEPKRIEPQWMEPTTLRSILARMSRNLRGCYASLEDWPQALRSADRCVDLLPEEPAERRDRGLLLWRMGQTQTALADLRHYMEARPEASDVQSVRDVVGRLRSFMN